MGNERLTMDPVFMLNYLDSCGAMYPGSPTVSSEACDNVLASIGVVPQETAPVAEFSHDPQLNPAGCKTMDECEERYVKACGREYPQMDNYSAECYGLYESMLNKTQQPGEGYFWSCGFNSATGSSCYQLRTDDNPACFSLFGASFLTSCWTHPVAVGIGELFNIDNYESWTMDNDPWGKVDGFGDRVY